MSSLRILIGEEAWQKLSKKYGHLDQLRYICKCETCDAVFFDTSCSAVQELLTSGKWNPAEPASQPWFMQAARHWLVQKFHSVRVHIVAADGDETLVKDLSVEWAALIPQIKRIMPKGMTVDRALQESFDRLEKRFQSD